MMKKNIHCYAIVLAGGSGARFGGNLPKQFQMLGDMPVFLHSTCKFDEIGFVDGIILVVPSDYLMHCQNLVKLHGLKKVAAIVSGGKSRQESTYNGLLEIRDINDDCIIIVHDAARPFVCEDEVALLVDAANEHKAAVLALSITDTIKVADVEQMVVQTMNRENLYAAKTPQAARMTSLLKAHEKAQREGFVATDDCQLIENIGIHPKIVITNANNIKITTAADLNFAEFLMERGMV